MEKSNEFDPRNMKKIKNGLIDKQMIKKKIKSNQISK